jgi:hypothetical protein
MGYLMKEEQVTALAEALSSHERTVKLGFMIYEILSAAGYEDEDIHEIADSMIDIVS